MTQNGTYITIRILNITIRILVCQRSVKAVVCF
jgi:hypothetical protein